VFATTIAAVGGGDLAAFASAGVAAMRARHTDASTPVKGFATSSSIRAATSNRSENRDRAERRNRSICIRGQAAGCTAAVQRSLYVYSTYRVLVAKVDHQRRIIGRRQIAVFSMTLRVRMSCATIWADGYRLMTTEEEHELDAPDWVEKPDCGYGKNEPR